jgi:predicted alpha/beta-fold hydrolase
MGHLCQCRISSPFFFVPASLTAGCLTNWLAKGGEKARIQLDDMRVRFMARTNSSFKSENDIKAARKKATEAY